MKVVYLDTDIGVTYHDLNAEVAQVVEHGTENAGVASSTLALGTFWSLKSGSGSVVEHLLAKERVVGSNPIFRSTKIGVK